jgi:hypothetical protein
MNPTVAASRSQANRIALHSQDPDYGLYTIDVKPGEGKPDAFKGIEVITEMYQESTKSTSQRRLVMDA